MSLFGSLYAGVSGLNAQSKSMGMISDNVANVSTTAYKGAAAQFAALVTRQAGASSYSPGGVRSLTSYAIANQGLIQATASPTDVAIAGAGFFVVNSLVDGTGEQLFTRAGSFSADADGNLRMPTGPFLQGWRLDAAGAVIDPNTVETVNTQVASGVSSPTTSVRIGANLDADQAAYTGAYAAGDLATWAATGGASGVEPHFARDLQVFDSLGRGRSVSMAFLKGATPNQWTIELYADPALVEQPPHPASGLLASGTIDFDGFGRLAGTAITPVVSGGVGDPVDIEWAVASGADPSTITFDLGTVGGSSGLTQLGADTDVSFVTQDGAPVGQLGGVSIDEDGFVIASFTNGQQRRIFQLPVATFPNPGGLDPRSGNLYAPGDAAGAVLLREAGVGGAGRLTPSALEAANVDLAEEFTKMIVTQRAYSANARVISTADEMLDELVRLR
jgi:flagellar hook protein FlgE